ncbi:27163_t:CDS:2 [Gigaspora margarita]|uniref:27163_t:CDS:1 n=1 Tax=Gigaspora margarita TaxID=4874 RepID=A0ABM8VVV1_GIGMA|nr:27163_t:CDS:2 [Gigaspora margarita]
MPKVKNKTKKIRNNPVALKNRSRLYNPYILAKKIKDRIRYINGKICQEGENVSYSNKITFYTDLDRIVETSKSKSNDLTLFEKIYNILEAEKKKNKRSKLEQKKRQYEEDLKRIYNAHQNAIGDQLNEFNELRKEKNNLQIENNCLENWITVLETDVCNNLCICQIFDNSIFINTLDLSFMDLTRRCMNIKISIHLCFFKFENK